MDGPRAVEITPAPAPRAPIDRVGATVMRALVEMVVLGTVEVGENLPPEPALCEAFGVSRTVVRETIKRLQEKGMVTVAQGRGTVVNPASSWNVMDPLVLSTLIAHDESLGILDDLSVTRAALEATMAVEVARTRDPEALEAIGRALEEMREAIADPATFFDADVRFHMAVMEASRNRIAGNMARTLFLRARESLRYEGALPADALVLTLQEHEAVFAAIRDADHRLAGESMQAHILGSWARRRLPSARSRWDAQD